MLFVVAFWLSALVTPYGAWSAQDPELAEIAKRLSRSAVLRADFHQEKTIKILSRPLLSRGRMIFHSGRGILWEINEPYAARMLLKSDHIIEWKTKGPPIRSGFAAVPVLRALSHVILSALAGDFDQLYKEFGVKKNPAGIGWWLTLSPKTPALAGVVSKVEIRGNRFIKSISLFEARGDQTVIQFSGFRTEPSDLDEHEKTYFAY
jgi:outer membrane lipoprotein-sorting protein